MNKRQLLSQLLGFILILSIWQLLSLLTTNAIVPSPSQTFIKLIELLQNDLLKHLGYSSYRIFMALFISILIGFPLGLLTGLNDTFDFIFSPIAYILYPIPKVAFLPLFMLLFGLGEVAKIILLISIIVFQIQISMRDSIRQIPNELFLSAKTLGLNRNQIIIHCIIPSLLPTLFSALKITTGISVSALFLSENFATTYGIGYYIMNSWIMVDYPAMFAGIVTLGCFGALLFKLIDVAQHRICKWKYLK